MHLISCVIWIVCLNFTLQLKENYVDTLTLFFLLYASDLCTTWKFFYRLT